MSKKLSPENLGEIAASNPFVDVRKIEEWRAINKELKRLGVDLSRRPAPRRPARPSAPPKAAPPRYIQRISIKHF